MNRCDRVHRKRLKRKHAQKLERLRPSNQGHGGQARSNGRNVTDADRATGYKVSLGDPGITESVKSRQEASERLGFLKGA